MSDYMFYTMEGETIAPNELVDVNNCQLLGFSKGSDKKMALEKLLCDNPWIYKAGYNITEIIGIKVLLRKD